jgi:ABC-2 type transport system permease protein
MWSFQTLFRKHLHESKWMLGLSALVLFGLGWLFVYDVSIHQTEIMKVLAQSPEEAKNARGRFQFLRRLGLNEQAQSVTFLMPGWKGVPIFMLTIALWAISRGSIAVAAEVERGTLDIVLSRPVTRFNYLTSQVVFGVFGHFFLAAALVAGTWIATRYNVLHEPPTLRQLWRPAANLAFLGLPIFGYTLLASSIDHVRWRPNLIGSVLTLGSIIAKVVAELSAFKGTVWKTWLERVSLANAYDPVDAVTKMETFGLHLGILAGVGLACIAIAYVAFAIRDLPTNG